ncbi:MAG: carboxypeptidase M32 [Phycisphaerales bacterium]|nr:MAG: carboxypeptidase M32 [Phycisphaerales bacterium]
MTIAQASATGSRVRSESYDELLRLLREAAVLGSVESLLSWDQETMMAPRGAPLRADQLSALSGITHAKRTDPRIGELIAACEADEAVTGDAAERVNLAEIKRLYERSTKLPGKLVSELARTSSEAMEAWKAARAKSDFAMFAPWLEKTFELHREKAACYGLPESPDGSPVTPYDALMADFEPGMTAHQVEAIFAPLRERLTALIGAIGASGVTPDDALLRERVPLEEQIAFNKLVAARLGFSFEGGRLDVSTHPFSETMGPGDVRMTTRYSEARFPEACLTTMHETGHSVYEQGLNDTGRFGQPLGMHISLGIHESQSRMLENFVGRSLPFWEWALPEARKLFTTDISRHTPEQAFRAVNAVRPHFIRVESDEATYNLHIMLRFDLERALLAGDLSVADLPGAWNERMRADLGLEVKEDRLGCLQDVHWSMGAIGYFPTYTLGNLYAGQMWDKIGADVPDLDDRMRRGDYAALLAWLHEHVHAVGRLRTAPALCEHITGSPLSHEPLMRHLEAKLGAIYGL